MITRPPPRPSASPIPCRPPARHSQTLAAPPLQPPACSTLRRSTSRPPVCILTRARAALECAASRVRLTTLPRARASQASQIDDVRTPHKPAKSRTSLPWMTDLTNTSTSTRTPSTCTPTSLEILSTTSSSVSTCATDRSPFIMPVFLSLWRMMSNVTHIILISSRLTEPLPSLSRYDLIAATALLPPPPRLRSFSLILDWQSRMSWAVRPRLPTLRPRMFVFCDSALFFGSSAANSSTSSHCITAEISL
mmetsp:Transcript_26094/g.69629  ORF Transcript_26094/g.69629 Transcript_26094/m.69629 type:complete len:250 (-) Transcript_26094:759-1508(-)